MKIGGGEAGKQGSGWQQRDCFCVALNFRLYLRECLGTEYKNLCIFWSVCAQNIKICAFSGAFVRRI